MTKRLQALLDDEELAEIQATARRYRQTTAAWVREALRAARRAPEPADIERIEGSNPSSPAILPRSGETSTHGYRGHLCPLITTRWT